MKVRRCRVYFVGAGPGDPELITVKGHNLIREADLVLYTGSLVPEELVAHARRDAKVVDSSSMTLEETHAMIVETARSGGLVARVHTGDPSLYGTIKEQMVLLDGEGIVYEIIPGVTAAFAASAAAKVSFTLPEKVQTLIITRREGRTPMPESEQLRKLAVHGTAMAIYLSGSDPEGVAEELLAGGYDEDTPVVVAYRAGWPEERLFAAKISTLVETVRKANIRRQVVFLILPGQMDDPAFSRLYSAEFSHGFRR